MVVTPKTMVIGENWQYSLTNANGTDTSTIKVNVGEWKSTKSFPTTVHVELLNEKAIPDPFIGLNEWDVQWVGECDWSFKTTFTINKEQHDAENVDLVFDGLDTFAVVELNGTPILYSSNQFVSHRVDVKKFLRDVGADNDLLINFVSAFRQGRAVEKEHGKYHLWNGDSSRLHVRKAQYNYGWDWGPVLMTTGPWKPVSLQSYNTQIEEIRLDVDVKESLDADVIVNFALVGVKQAMKAVVSLVSADGGATIASREIGITPNDVSGSTSFQLVKDTFKLWYPVGYGKQPLYEATVELKDANGNNVNTKAQQFGFRRVQVLQNELDGGHTFVFEINNIRIFCGGSNWIPADSFLTTMTESRYRDWLQLVVDGNQNMVRVWGGGIYEADDFYDICDELGILVWQDFMFGCGQYPGYSEFVDSVKIEAEQNVKRLRHHPSVVIFAGNNEDYQLIESLGVDQNDATKFPARKIYEEVLPKIVQDNCNIPYHCSSPYSGYGQPTTDQTNGDLHQWNVWHGSQQSWHNWDKLAGRFVSEFGMQAYPNVRTVDYWLDGNEAERFPQSGTTANHNKADGFERRLELYLIENFKHSFDMESYIYYTQIMQAEALASAYRLWRRNWKGPGKEYTAGALVWQINDCWPVTSWAIVDYFLRPKPAYFTIKRELRLYTVGMTRKDQTVYPDELSVAKSTINTVLEVWSTNSTLTAKKVTLEVTSFKLDDPSYVDKWPVVQATLAPNASTELTSQVIYKRTKLSEVPPSIIVSARLVDENGQVLGRYSNWPEPFKFLTFPDVSSLGLDIQSTSVDGAESVRLSSQRPIKGIVLDVEGGGEDVEWGDQAIDLVPGDPQVITAVGLQGRKVTARFLGDGTA